MVFGIIGWLVVGLLVGFIVSKIVDLHGDDPLIVCGCRHGFDRDDLLQGRFGRIESDFEADLNQHRL